LDPKAVGQYLGVQRYMGSYSSSTGLDEERVYGCEENLPGVAHIMTPEEVTDAPRKHCRVRIEWRVPRQ
jgi:hypothetical protein